MVFGSSCTNILDSNSVISQKRTFVYVFREKCTIHIFRKCIFSNSDSNINSTHEQIYTNVQDLRGFGPVYSAFEFIRPFTAIPVLTKN